MELYYDKNGVGLLERLRNRGFWAYFLAVAILVFVLLTVVDFGVPFIYGQAQPELNLDFVWDVGVNIAVSVLSAGIAWQVNGKPLINRPDTIKLDLDK